MASTFTPNLGADLMGSGDHVGTWDSPTNSNWNIYDRKLGAIQNINLAAGNVTLTTVQAQSAFLIFSGALAGNTTVTIPGLSSSPGVTISGGGYTINNICTNSSQFTVTIATTVAGQRVIGAPPFEMMDIYVEGTGSPTAGSVRYRGLDRVGSYWDYGGSSVPGWVSACTVPPYLNCDGSTFSAATYPMLALVLGSTTLPDARGRYRAALNQGTGRITSTGAAQSVDGNTLKAGGGAQTLARSNLPNVDFLTDTPTFTIQLSTGSSAAVGTKQYAYDAGGTLAGAGAPINTVTGNASMAYPVGHIYLNANVTQVPAVPPSYIGGLTLIRSA